MRGTRRRHPASSTNRERRLAGDRCRIKAPQARFGARSPSPPACPHTHHLHPSPCLARVPQPPESDWLSARRACLLTHRGHGSALDGPERHFTAGWRQGITTPRDIDNLGFRRQASRCGCRCTYAVKETPVGLAPSVPAHNRVARTHAAPPPAPNEMTGQGELGHLSCPVPHGCVKPHP
jgi:hypothetical protein